MCNCRQHAVRRQRGSLQMLNIFSIFDIRTKSKPINLNAPPDANRQNVNANGPQRDRLAFFKNKSFRYHSKFHKCKLRNCRANRGKRTTPSIPTAFKECETPKRPGNSAGKSLLHLIIRSPRTIFRKCPNRLKNKDKIKPPKQPGKFA